MNIALVKFKCSHEQLRDAVLKLDDKVIRGEDVGRLRLIMPTADEVELLQSQDGAAAFGAAEKFLLLMAAVPRLRQRLECFQAKMNFDSRVMDADAQVNALLWATDAVRKSKRLPQLLSLILQLGNFLNEGSAKGAAEGFRFDVLQKLSDTKSSASEGSGGQISLLHYLARCVTKQQKELQRELKSELAALEEAHQPPLTSANIEEEIAALAKEIEMMRSELPHHATPFSPVDAFSSVIEEFVSSASDKLARLQKKRDEMYTQLGALHTYLGQDQPDGEPEQVLSRVHAFAVSFGKACRDNEREELLQKKQAADAKAKPSGGGGVRSAVRKKLAVPSHVMSSIQGSLRRGEFAQMKALQAQMSHELAHRMAVRRNSITGSDD